MRYMLCADGRELVADIVASSAVSRGMTVLEECKETLKLEVSKQQSKMRRAWVKECEALPEGVEDPPQPDYTIAWGSVLQKSVAAMRLLRVRDALSQFVCGAIDTAPDADVLKELHDARGEIERVCQEAHLS